MCSFYWTLSDTIPMARRHINKLENATSRRKLPTRKKPYWVTLTPGIALGYRRNEGAGTWSVRCHDKNTEWVRRLAFADDFDPPDNDRVLSYWQAEKAARDMVRDVTGRGTGRPLTIAEALDRYEQDLVARNAGTTNAKQPRLHTPPWLAGTMVSTVTADELIRWRDGLLAAGMIPPTFNRMRKGLRAALNLAAERDPRITNVRAWKVGLRDLPDAHTARNVILSLGDVQKVVRCAYAVDPGFGLYVELLATTGARASQLDRLLVGDLQADRLMLPTSKKGRGQKVIRRYPVPISPELARKLKTRAIGRAADAPLLLTTDGTPWLAHIKRNLFRDVATAAGFDPDVVTPYALRHSSIVRMLQRGLAIRLVASHHDTSVIMIERNYSAFITAHSDDLIRATLPEISPVPAVPADDAMALPVGRQP
jgi:integrase